MRAVLAGRAGSPAELVVTLGGGARRLGGWLDHRAVWVYGALIALVMATCRLAIVSFTIEPDESWILLSTYKAFHLAPPGAEGIRFPTITSGGLHLLVHGLLGLATRAILFHRLVSLLFLAGLLAMVFALLRRRGTGRGQAAMATALVLATPGLVLQSALAMAEIMVTVVLLATAIHWERRGRLSLAGSALTGMLLGLSCATRTNCLVAMPVFVAFAALDAEDWARGLSRAAALAAAALATYALGVLGYAALFSIGDWNGFKAAILGATGVAKEKGLGQRIPDIALAADFFPPFLIAALLGAIAACRPRGIEPLRLPLLLVALGLAGAAAWVAKAPIPHVRYAWPFAPFLFVAAGLMVPLTGLLAQGWTRLALHLFVIAAVLQQTATSLVYINTGDSLVAVYQANRQAILSGRMASHSSAADQQAMARALAALPAQAEVTTPTTPMGYPLTYLSGREIRGVLPWNDAGSAPRYVLLSPGDFAVFHPDAKTIAWLHRNGTPAFHSGEYALFAITGHEPYPTP
ncbi:hypothetical protein ACFOD9_06845 [Novosphingobium bradum]|uniref:Glycosyltransferase RgtA/B/C/D-like domain-containing protein n=1 Tax=Novosphingobium bradum TaxID=1737444 RepID=A0ABV7IT11_9SPHN